MTFDVHKCESMENTLKINDLRESISLYNYIHDESLDLCEIGNIRSLVISQLLCNELKFQIS